MFLYVALKCGLRYFEFIQGVSVMKKLLSLIVSISLALSCLPYTAIATENVKVVLDGQPIEFDVPAQIINGRTMVPMRVIFEKLGATVDWNNDTQTVISTRNGTTISLTINNSTMFVNGKGIMLDSPACLVDGRTLVPVRAISEAFDIKVKWEDVIQTVLLSTTGKFVEPNVTMYAADGRTQSVPASQVESNLSVGWYLEPVTTMYALDGRTAIVSKSDVVAWREAGWYFSPRQTVYKVIAYDSMWNSHTIDAFNLIGSASQCEDIDVSDKTIYIDNECTISVASQYVNDIWIYPVSSETTIDDFVEEYGYKEKYFYHLSSLSSSSKSLNLQNGSYIACVNVGGEVSFVGLKVGKINYITPLSNKIAKEYNNIINQDKYQDYMMLWCDYTIYDIDKDSIPELIIDIGSDQADRRIHIYTFENGQAKYIGESWSSHSYFASIPDKNGIMKINAHSSQQYAEILSIKDGIINDEELFYKYLTSEEWIANNERYYNPNELYDGSAILDFFKTNDLSGFKTIINT